MIPALLLLAELGLTVLVAAAAVLLGLPEAVSGALAQAAGRGGDPERDAAAFQALADSARLAYGGGILALILGRVVGYRRQATIAAPVVLPALALMTGMGLCLQFGYSDPLHASAGRLYGPPFASGVLLGGIVSGLILAIPWDPGRVIVRGRWVIAGAGVALMLALAAFGTEPGTSGARVNLLGVQPVEVVKLAFIAFLAAMLGRNAEQLRYQRSRLGPIHAPRLALLLPALLLTSLLYALMFVVKDLGPTLILTAVLLALYYAAVRSWVEIALLGAAASAALLVVFVAPPVLLPNNVLIRVGMMKDPWLNGAPGGDQLASSLWALAAGGLRGQGLGWGYFGALPAGHTDLILAHLAEVAGLAGLALYGAALLGLMLQGLWIAAVNRTPERMLLALGVVALVLAQVAIIFAGTAGLLPLTGVVVPYLSFGKSSMIAFMAAAALLVRLAVGGRRQVEEDALQQVRGGALVLALAALLVAGVCGAAGAARTLWKDTSARGAITVGSDDAVFFRYDPRIRALAARIPRGEIRDRSGQVLAGNAADGARTYPLGAAMGTLLGPFAGGVTAPDWAIEGQQDAKLRGLADVPDELGVYIEIRPDAADPATGGLVRRRDRILFTVDTHEYRDADKARAEAMIEEEGAHFFTPIRQVDYGPLVPLLHMTRKQREAALAALAADIDKRSVSLTIDARLQQAAYKALAQHAAKLGRAGAVVVLDADTGEVLARAQWPDYDPNQPDAWKSKLLAQDPKFMGSYGPWKDKTGVGGFYQAGSVFKVATALAAVRSGAGFSGRRCQASGGHVFGCTRSDGRPYFTLPSWTQPIHDDHTTPDGPAVDLPEALEVSCNVYFSQLGLALGPGAFTDLVAAGLEIDQSPQGRPFEPGAPGSRQLASTAYGQGASRMHALQAARMVATVGGGGVYRKCPASMLLGQPCEAKPIADPGALTPILAGMARVIDSGTARSFAKLSGVRVYGKTGTATDLGRKDEVPYGIQQGSEQPSHSWFVALAEPGANDPCQPQATGRLAVAAVVPRGGFGSGAARLVAQDVIAAANSFGYFAP